MLNRLLRTKLWYFGKLFKWFYACIFYLFAITIVLSYKQIIDIFITGPPTLFPLCLLWWGCYPGGAYFFGRNHNWTYPSFSSIYNLEPILRPLCSVLLYPFSPLIYTIFFMCYTTPQTNSLKIKNRRYFLFFDTFSLFFDRGQIMLKEYPIYTVALFSKISYNLRVGSSISISVVIIVIASVLILIIVASALW